MQLQKIIILVILLLVCSPMGLAQTDERKVEVFLGVSAIGAQNALANKDIKTFGGFTPAQFRALAGFELLDNERYIPGYGFEANVTRYFSKHVGLSGDFSGYYRRANARIADTLFKADHKIYYVMGGPKVKLLNEHRANLFFHALPPTPASLTTRTSLPIRQLPKTVQCALHLHWAAASMSA